MSSTFRELRYAPREVRRVLRRAAEIAETDPETSAAERALTQDEIEQRALELGLPASAVRRAILAPHSPEPSGERPWMKPRQVLLEQELPGEVPADRHEEIVDAIRSVLGVEGRTEVVGKTITWSLPRAVTPLITIRSKDGQTRVRVEEKLNGAGTFLSLTTLSAMLSLMGVGVGMDAMRSPFVAGAIGSVMMVCFGLVSAFLAARAVRRREALLEHVMDRVGAAVNSAIASYSPSPPRVRVAEVNSAKAEVAAATGAAIEAEAEAEAAMETAAEEAHAAEERS